MCNDDAKGNFLIYFINGILFQLKIIFQKKKTTLIFARFSRNFNPWEWLDSKSDQLYLSHNVICLQKGGPFYIFWLNLNLYHKSNQASHPKWDRSHYYSWNYWLWLNPIPSPFLKSNNLYQNRKSKLQNLFILSEH